MHMFTPREAVKRVWSCTSAFAGAEQTGPVLTYSDATFKEILKETHPAYKRYVIETKSTMDVALRALETHYHGRQLNYDQVRDLGKKMDESVRDDVVGGLKMIDLIAGIPAAVAVTAYVGEEKITQTIYDLLGWENAISFVFLFSLLAYLLFLLLTSCIRLRLRWSYIWRDFQITWYYIDYLNECRDTLIGLMKDVQNLYTSRVNRYYNMSGDMDFVNRLMDDIRPAFCPKFNDHVEDGRLTPDVWTLCEMGDSSTPQRCKRNSQQAPGWLLGWWRKRQLSRFWKV